jgi:quinohemoprotein ethanol dehydrogenase
MRALALRLPVLVLLLALLGPAPSAAQPAPNLREPASKDWLTIGGDWGATRYSTLNQINASNVKDLKGAWVTHLGSGLGSKYSLEATPLVQNGIMYLATGNDDLYVLDATTGQEIWEYHSGIDQNISTVCCGWDNRGVALGQGAVYMGQLDGTFVALDQRSGEVLWKTQIEDWHNGYTITAAPLYYDGIIYTGISGGERGIRGRLTALDAHNGQMLWQFYTIPGPNDLGGDSWPSPNDPDPDKATVAMHGGAGIWNAPTVDPDLGMIYFSTGNAGPDYDGSIRPGDNLFAVSIIALDAKSGQYKWHFQEVHHDIWDYDSPSPTILFDVNKDGQPRKAIAQAGKTGWVYLLDRTNGKPLVGIDERPVPQEAGQATAATQPYPVGDALVPQCAEPVPNFLSACIFEPFTNIPKVFQPGPNGGVNWANMSFDPQTGWLYATAGVRPSAFMQRKYTLVNGLWQSAPGGGTPLGAKYSGTYTALDPTTNKIVWQKKTTYSLHQGSGTLSTAGGLLFHGEPDGNFQALDPRTGDMLWQWQTGAGADAPAITYEVNGKQYVAIAAGGVATQTVSANGDLLWAFSLDGAPNGRLQPFSAPTPPATEVAFTGVPTATNAVQIVDYAFAQSRITVPAGTTVTWRNTGTTIHTATAQDQTFDTGDIQPNGGTAQVTFDNAGTFTYTCSPHPWMLAQVIVTPKT